MLGSRCWRSIVVVALAITPLLSTAGHTALEVTGSVTTPAFKPGPYNPITSDLASRLSKVDGIAGVSDGPISFDVSPRGFNDSTVRTHVFEFIIHNVSRARLNPNSMRELEIIVCKAINDEVRDRDATAIFEDCIVSHMQVEPVWTVEVILAYPVVADSTVNSHLCTGEPIGRIAKDISMFLFGGTGLLDFKVASDGPPAVTMKVPDCPDQNELGEGGNCFVAHPDGAIERCWEVSHGLLVPAPLWILACFWVLLSTLYTMRLFAPKDRFEVVSLLPIPAWLTPDEGKLVHPSPRYVPVAQTDSQTATPSAKSPREGPSRSDPFGTPDTMSR